VVRVIQISRVTNLALHVSETFREMVLLIQYGPGGSRYVMFVAVALTAKSTPGVSVFVCASD
jgi:hypothetical protein